MRFCNSLEGRAKLRREQFNRNQSNGRFGGKKSLGKRIIEERVGGITANNIEKECNRLLCMTEIDGLLEQITYHLKFAADAYPSTFNEDKIMQTIKELKCIRIDFSAGSIDAEQYVKFLKSIDNHIMDEINNLSQCK